MATRKRKGERPDGLIQVSLMIGYKGNGKPDRKYFYGHTRAEAIRKRDEYKAQRETGLRLDPNMTVEQWVEIFKETYRTNIDEFYLDMDATPYNRLVKRLGKMRLMDVRESDLQSALNAVSGMSFSTVDKYAQAIRRVFARARKNRLIAENPATDLILPGYVKGTHRALECWEIDLILDNWDCKEARTGLWVLLMMLCGLRRGEMMGLQWDAIDLEADTLEVRRVAVIHHSQTKIVERAKSEAGLRTLPICNILHDALSAVPPEKRVGPVCVSAKGQLLTQSAVDRGIQTFCHTLERILNGEEPDQRGRRRSKMTPEEIAKLEARKKFSFTCHDLRHTYATSLYDAGVEAKDAQYLLGHADIRLTLELYTHLSRERKQKTRAQVAAYLDRWLDSRIVSSHSVPRIEAQEEPENS